MANLLTVGAARDTLTPDDVAKVSFGNLKVDLDVSNLSRVRKESPKPGAFQAEQLDEIDVDPEKAAGESTSFESHRFSPERTRAALLCVLKRLAAGNSGVRDVLLTSLASLVNQSQARLDEYATDAQVLAPLCTFFHGRPEKVSLAEETARAVLGAAPPAVSAAERLQLEGGLPVTCGLMCLATVQLSALQSLCTAVLALSCDALRASSAPFDASRIEAGQNKLAVAVGAEVLSLLEGSTQINAKPRDGGTGTVPELTQGFLKVAELQAANAASSAATRGELAAAAAPAPLPTTDTLPNAATALTMAGLAVAACGLSRTEMLAQALQAQAPDGAAAGPTHAESSLQQSATLLVEKLRAQGVSFAGRAQKRAQAAVSAAMAPVDVPTPGASSALLAADIADWLQQCIALEALLAVLVLRRRQDSASAAKGALCLLEERP